MITIIEKLIAGNHAYAADGHVLFSVPSMADYGRLSRRPLDEMIAGARVDVAPYKKGDMDFVLWKPSKPEEPGWDSPWGRGRPGWHIECSAMSWKHLGEVFDIHGGGIDLVFPHHENEIAQSRCAFGHNVMANVWMHNGFLQVEGEKMSKSLGNFVTINELLETEKFGGKKWDGQVLRLAMLKTHYRQPIDWTLRSLQEAEATLDEWFASTREASASEPSPAVIEALSDDLNTSQVITELHRLSKSGDLAALVASLSLLGFDGSTYRSGLKQDIEQAWDETQRDDVQQRIDARIAARESKNWAESDRIRDELVAMGIQIMDAKDPATGKLVTTWEVKR
jgi:cysteinyl-tRNA synthetase